MMLRVVNSCRRFTSVGRFAFGVQAKEETKPYLSSQEIKEKLAPEEYSEIVGQLKKQGEQELARHQNRLLALEKLLSESQKARIRTIEQLLAGLNEQEAEYIRFKLLSHVEFEHA
jgi:hypothetical protein